MGMARTPMGLGTTEGRQLWFQPHISQMRQRYFRKWEKLLHSVGHLLPGLGPFNMAYNKQWPVVGAASSKANTLKSYPQALQVSQTSVGCEVDPPSLSSRPTGNHEPSESGSRCRGRAGKTGSWGNFLPKLQNWTWSPIKNNNTWILSTTYHNQAFKPEVTLKKLLG